MESFSADRVSSEPDNTLTSDAGDASDGFVLMLAPVEAARRLGVTRSRIYALVQQGELDDVGGQTLRVTLESVERRLAANAPVGEPIKPLGAWGHSGAGQQRRRLPRSRRRQALSLGTVPGQAQTQGQGLTRGCAAATQARGSPTIHGRCRVAARCPRGCTWRPGWHECRAAARLAAARR
jgi:hypothetical protein